MAIVSRSDGGIRVVFPKKGEEEGGGRAVKFPARKKKVNLLEKIAGKKGGEISEKIFGKFPTEEKARIYAQAKYRLENRQIMDEGEIVNLKTPESELKEIEEMHKRFGGGSRFNRILFILFSGKKAGELERMLGSPETAKRFKLRRIMGRLERDYPGIKRQHELNEELILASAAFGGSRKMAEYVKSLLRKGAHANARDEKMMTPLMRASMFSPEIASALIESGAKLDETAANGKTAAMFAAERGQNEIIKMLAWNGADLKKKDCWGLTAREHAELAGKKETMKIIEEILAKKTGAFK